ncbi:MAG: holo-ACP synthase [Gammaproteobacteria bacterium]|nr:holo-ACP synthase [Gammaproteobacteria bacterium]
MIFGIGVDLCKIKRIKKLKTKYGDKFVRKLLTDEEFQQFEQRKKPEQFLASRFAAKEAAVKALGTGFIKGITLKDIEVLNETSGKPVLNFHRQALKVVDEQKINSAFISLSDEKGYAVAMVVLELD